MNPKWMSVQLARNLARRMARGAQGANATTALFFFLTIVMTGVVWGSGEPAVIVVAIALGGLGLSLAYAGITGVYRTLSDEARNAAATLARLGEAADEPPTPVLGVVSPLNKEDRRG